MTTYPSNLSIETVRAAAGIATSSNVVEHVRVGVQSGIDEADGALAGLHALAVDEAEQRRDGRGGAARAEDLGEVAVDDDAEPGAVGGDVGNAFLVESVSAWS